MAGSQDPHGSGSESRLSVNGQALRVIKTFEPPTERAAELVAQGKGAPALHEIGSEHADVYRSLMADLNEGNKWFASVHIYSTEEYSKMRLFLAEGGKAGIAVKDDGDIVSVFSSKEAPASANSMIATAVASLGGRKLDCFDTVLPSIYKQEGFEVVHRDAWDDQYKPDGWDYETYAKFNNGRPDIVYMEHRG